LITVTYIENFGGTGGNDFMADIFEIDRKFWSMPVI
jgi:hypothetical protein